MLRKISLVENRIYPYFSYGKTLECPKFFHLWIFRLSFRFATFQRSNSRKKFITSSLHKFRYFKPDVPRLRPNWNLSSLSLGKITNLFVLSLNIIVSENTYKTSLRLTLIIFNCWIKVLKNNKIVLNLPPTNSCPDFVINKNLSKSKHSPTHKNREGAFFWRKTDSLASQGH